MFIYETDEWKKETAKLQKNAIETGGGGSNMAEPLYFQSGPLIPNGLPPEEVVRRKKRLEEVDKLMKELDEREEKD